jgi:SAM-dependent methyltransferase
MSARYGDALPHLIAEITARYDVGRRYAAAYLARYEHPESLPTSAPIPSLEAFLQLPAPYPAWFEYAMGVNARGSMIADWLIPFFGDGAHSILDIGCGAGGTVIALTQRGFATLGCDTDADLVTLARANAHDHAVLNAIVHGDICHSDFARRLGRFDAIIMLGVVGTIHDSARALHHALSRLHPKGVLIVDAPNAYAIAGNQDAAPLEYYLSAFAYEGYQAEQIDSPLYPADLGALYAQIDELIATPLPTPTPEIPIARQLHTQMRRSERIARLIHDATAYHDNILPEKTFTARYAPDRWTFAVRPLATMR